MSDAIGTGIATVRLRRCPGVGRGPSEKRQGTAQGRRSLGERAGEAKGEAPQLSSKRWRKFGRRGGACRFLCMGEERRAANTSKVITARNSFLVFGWRKKDGLAVALSSSVSAFSLPQGFKARATIAW